MGFKSAKPERSKKQSPTKVSGIMEHLQRKKQQERAHEEFLKRLAAKRLKEAKRDIYNQSRKRNALLDELAAKQFKKRQQEKERNAALDNLLARRQRKKK